MAHQKIVCDVIDCPDCRARDNQADRQRSWLGATTWLASIVKRFHDWTVTDIEVADDEVWASGVSVQLTLDLPNETPDMLAGETSRRLRALADAIDREVYRREGFRAALERAS